MFLFVSFALAAPTELDRSLHQAARQYEVPEEILKALAYEHGLTTRIHGKDVVAAQGEYVPEVVLAALARFLLSGEASWMTGQVIALDGGRSTVRPKASAPWPSRQRPCGPVTVRSISTATSTTAATTRPTCVAWRGRWGCEQIQYAKSPSCFVGTGWRSADCTKSCSIVPCSMPWPNWTRGRLA